MNNLPIQWLLTKFFNEYPHYRPPTKQSASPPISDDDEYEPPSDYDTDEDGDL